MRVPQFVPHIDVENEGEAVLGCFRNKWITEGRKTKEFSDALLQEIGAKYGVFAPNGTLALFLGLLAMEIGPGDEVIVPDLTFIASANAVTLTGATPIFVDVGWDLQISIQDCERVLSKNTKAIMPVHLFGLSANMTEVMGFAEANQLGVIEDAAQALCVKWQDQPCGSFGDVGCFSFFADKTITTGEGGFVVTNDGSIHQKLLLLRNQGRLDRGSFIHPEIGYNFRMTDIQSAVGLAQLRKLRWIISMKRNAQAQYEECLQGVPEIKLLQPGPGSNHVPFRVVAFAEGEASVLSRYLEDQGIESRSMFYPLHRQDGYKAHCPTEETFKGAIHAWEHGICLPTYATMEREQIIYVCDKIKEYYGH